jgi:hypothetical protein
MELDALKSAWQAHESDLASKAKLNARLLDKIEAQKVRSTVRPLLVENIVAMIFHLLIIIGLLVFLIYHISDIYYAVSALVLLGYYVFLSINAGRQIREIKSMGRGSDVVSMQSSLIRLTTHKLDFVRLSVLTIPVFLSFPVVIPKALEDLNIQVFKGFDIISQTHGAWWSVEIIACLVLIPLGAWFYMQVKPGNIYKNWVRNVINKTTGRNVRKAIEYLNELEALKVQE